MAQFFLGLDLGQKQDYTAIAIVERAEAAKEFDRVNLTPATETRYHLRHLERVALDTPYPQVVERVRELARSGKLAGRCAVAADATGVGAAVTITGGDRAARGDGGWRVPKRDLVVGLQVMLEAGSLRIAAELREAEAFVQELTNMRVKISASGHESFAAWREGAHDDLVLAVALACWRARWPPAGHVGRSLGL